MRRDMCKTSTQVSACSHLRDTRGPNNSWARSRSKDDAVDVCFRRHDSIDIDFTVPRSVFRTLVQSDRVMHVAKGAVRAVKSHGHLPRYYYGAESTIGAIPGFGTTNFQ